jgi:hypothetical protein
LQIHDVLTLFRSAFKGKSSPVQFFWGGFDLSVAFYTGRKAPRKNAKIPGLPDHVLQDAFNRELIECGFWPGNDAFPQAFFYCYIYPEPKGYQSARISPSAAAYNKEISQFILPYSAVRDSTDPEATLLQFLETTYAAGAANALWADDLFDFTSASYPDQILAT